MSSSTNALPVMDADNLVGVVFVLARSYERGTITLFQVTCVMQDEPQSATDIWCIGNFKPCDLLDWGYAGKLCESGQFEAPGLWDYMLTETGRDPVDMLAWRPMLGANLEALQVMANMEANQLAALFPQLQRAA